MKNMIYSKFMWLVLTVLVFAGCVKTPEPEKIVSIKIEVADEVDTSSVRVKFIPAENSIRYEYAISEGTDMYSFESGAMSGIISVDGDGVSEATFTDLIPGTDYTIYARAYSETNTPSGISVCKVRTMDNQFNVKMQYLTDNSAGFEISFTQKYYAARYYLGLPEDSTAFASGDLGDYMYEVIGYNCVNDFYLESEKDYVFYVEGIDRGGNKRKIINIPFRTYSASEYPEPEIQADIDIYKGIFTLIPDAECGGVVCCVAPEGALNRTLGSWNYDYVSMLISWEGIGQLTYSTKDGSPLIIENITPDLKTDARIEVYVIVLDKNFEPIGLKYYDYQTPAFDESIPLPSPVKVSISNVTDKGATYTFEADETVFAYMFDTVEADWYDDFVKNDPAYNEFYLHNLFFQNGMYYHYGSGNYSWTEDKGVSNFRYYAAAAPMNANGPGKGWGSITLVDYITE